METNCLHRDPDYNKGYEEPTGPIGPTGIPHEDTLMRCQSPCGIEGITGPCASFIDCDYENCYWSIRRTIKEQEEK